MHAQVGQPRGRRRSAAPPVEQAEQLLDIVFVSSEVAPWSKTGGLGDVVGSLPIALAARGHRVMVVAPRRARTCPLLGHLIMPLLEPLSLALAGMLSA